MHGWIVLDKPLGLGSTQAVSAVKRALRQGGYAKAKVGHGGTLDPLATGVLPIAVGEATKLAGRLLDSDKIYEFTVRFGEETDSLDAEGAVTATSPVRPTRAEVEAVLASFTGPVAQVPPIYSALKVDGARAYDLARAGLDVLLTSRNVTIHALILSSLVVAGEVARVSATEGEARTTAGAHAPSTTASRRSPSPAKAREEIGEVTFLAHVSKGTYIRSLARDIAHALGTVGHVTVLRRTKAGPFDLAHAITLDTLAELGQARALEDILLPLRAGLDDIPALLLTPDQAGALRQGRVLAGIAATDGAAFAMLGDVPVALVDVVAGEVRVTRGFNLSMSKDDA